MSEGHWAGRARRAAAVALAACAVALGAVPALASSSTSYRGRSSQGLPVTIAVSGSQIRLLTIAWMAECPALHAPLKGITTYHQDVALSKSAWSVQGSYGASMHGGYTEVISVRDHGAFSGSRRVSGVFAGTVQIYRGQGRKHRRIDTCQSGKVTFTLNRSR